MTSSELVDWHLMAISSNHFKSWSILDQLPVLAWVNKNKNWKTPQRYNIVANNLHIFYTFLLKHVLILLHVSGHGHPTPIHIQTLTDKYKKYLKCPFFLFSIQSSRPMDRRTDWQTTFYEVACPYLN